MIAAETVQLRALGIALGDVHWKAPDGLHIGTFESGPNDGERIREMLENAGIGVAAPWCAAAVQLWTDLACDQLDVPNPLDAVRQEALVQSYVDWGTQRGKVVPRDAVIPGDLVCFSFGGRRYDHIGLLRYHEPGGETVSVVEGNTFLEDGDDDAPGQRGEREGYEVEVKDRRLHYARPTLFIRWAEDVLEAGS